MAGVNTYGYMRRLAFAAVAAAALIGPANAFTIGVEPLGTTTNDVFGNGVTGYFGANLFATANLSITYELVGYEAGFTNTFNAPAGNLTGGGGTAGTLTSPLSGNLNAPTSNFATATVLGGLLNFSFSTTGGGAPAVNGSNPDGTMTSAPNFFVSFFNSDNPANWTAANLGAFGGGDAGIIAFDDGGGARTGFPSDGDYDDLVIFFKVNDVGPGQQISPVPETSTWAMMLIGFAGLGFLAYRRKQNVTFRLV